LHVFVAVSQSDAFAVGQSVFVKHDTHVFALVLQTRLDGSAPQFTDDKQLTHVDVSPSHTRFNGSVEQSEPKTQPTHTYSALQTGFVASLQSVLVMHSTHLFAKVLQAGVLPEHVPLQGIEVVPPVDDSPPLVPPVLLPPSFVPPVSFPPWDEPPAYTPPVDSQVSFDLQSSERLEHAPNDMPNIRMQNLVCVVVITVESGR
jgi:hypothetical protein